MKVLFISSGKNGSVSILVRNQGESLKKKGIEVDYFMIRPGLTGYITSIFKIRKKYKSDNFDLAHAHYSLSGIVASLAGVCPLIVSLMGSDAYNATLIRQITRFFYKNKWNATIVKTNKMKELLGFKNSFILPNGVDLERFNPKNKLLAREKLKLPFDKKIVLFISVLNRPEKNFDLAKKAVNFLNDEKIELLRLHNIPNSEIPDYLNAAELLLLTSKWEGSVNVIKEAMACNCPIVATEVGDIKWIIGDTLGCSLTTFDHKDIAAKILKTLALEKRTNGRDRIIQLGLDSQIIASKLINIYKLVTSKKMH
ncbi:MAG: glycosyltransferase family 4 protein [Candidatus Methanofastidiosa archaeon]|nr:glycosyltransferase family 4 protein [Candidatus Methanofastidiosa archaeon]